MSLSNFIDSPTLMSPQIDKKRISWNLQSNETDIDMLSHELELILNVKSQNIRQQSDETKKYNLSGNSSLGIKFQRIKNRQTSPLMNILCNKTHTDVNSLRIKRRVLDCTKIGLSKTFTNNGKNRLSVPFP
jgi:hypothetical protein